MTQYYTTRQTIVINASEKYYRLLKAIITLATYYLPLSGQMTQANHRI